MRYRLIPIGVALALIPALNGCKKQAQPFQSQQQIQAPRSGGSNEPAATLSNQATPAIATATPAEKLVLLKVQWPVGNRYIYRMDLEQHSTNQISPSPAPRVEDLTLGVTYGLEVLKGIADDGSRKLELQFLANEMESKMAERVLLSFDSSTASTNDAQNPIASPFRKVVGSKVQLEVDRDGRVEKVIGLDLWANSVVGDDIGAGAHMLVQQFNDGFFRQVADFGRGLSAQPIAVGQSWPFRSEVPAGTLGRIAVESTITFKRWEEHEAHRFTVLEARGTLKGITGSATNSETSLTLDQGTVASTSWFDPELGALIESEVVQVMRVKGEIPSQPDGSRPALSFTSDIGQKVIVKLVDFQKATR